MKCSTCGFITDPTKDLCSRCFTDLRNLKKELGLTINDETTPYEVLLSRRVKIVDSKQAVPQLNTKKSFFNSLWRKKAAAQDTKVPNAFESDSNINLSIQEPNSDAFKFSESSPSTMERESELPKVEKLQPQKLRMGKRQRQQISGIFRRRKIESQTAHQNEDILLSELSAEEAKLQRIEFPQRPFSEKDQNLWIESQSDLVKRFGAMAKASNIQISSLMDTKSQQALSVYFDLAFDELSFPKSKKTFIDQFKDRKVERIESEDLKDAISKYEKTQGQVKAEGVLGVDHDWNLSFKTPVPTFSRLMSWLLDAIVAFLLALAITLTISSSHSSVAQAVLLGDTIYKNTDFLALIAAALPIFYLVLVFVLPIFRFLFGATVGEMITGLRLVSTNSKHLRLTTSLNWSLFAILALVSGGFLEFRRPRGLWREKILGARLLRSSSE